MSGFPALVRSLSRSITPIMGCLALATPGGAQAPSLPDSAGLVSRMTALHRAMAAGDAAAWYALATPVVRRHMTLEQFQADLRMEPPPEGKPEPKVSARLERNCGCQSIPMGQGAVRCVTILRVTADSGAVPSGRWIESWDRIDRQWYWVYGTPHAHNPVSEPPRCPGEP